METRHWVKVWLLACAASTASAGCSPAIDWRSLRPVGLGLELTMPCRPASQVRPVNLAGRTFEMTLYTCNEMGVTYSLGTFDVADPALVGAMLMLLVKASQTNLQAEVISEGGAQVPGMTPHPQARQIHLAGRLPDGRAVSEWLHVFSRGTRVYQAVVMGGATVTASAQQFASGLKVLP